MSTTRYIKLNAEKKPIASNHTLPIWLIRPSTVYEEEESEEKSTDCENPLPSLSDTRTFLHTDEANFLHTWARSKIQQK